MPVDILKTSEEEIAWERAKARAREEISMNKELIGSSFERGGMRPLRGVFSAPESTIWGAGVMNSISMGVLSLRRNRDERRTDHES